MKIEDLAVGHIITSADVASLKPIALGDPNSEHMRLLNNCHDLEKITNFRNRTYASGRRKYRSFSQWNFEILCNCLEEVFEEGWCKGKLFSFDVGRGQRAFFTKKHKSFLVIKDNINEVQHMSGIEVKAITLLIRKILGARVVEIRKELKANPSLKEKVLAEKKLKISVQSVDAIGILHEAKEALGSVISALERGSVTDATINGLYEKIEKLKSERNSIRLLLLKIKKLDK